MNRELLEFTLQLADNALILGHRNSEWCGHGPILEQDIAISNISLDLIGQARNFYQYAATMINEHPALLQARMEHRSDGGINEDSLAYFRDARDFRNIVLVEQPRGDWAVTILRQFFFSAFQELLFERLSKSSDPQLASISGKSLKEIAYHIRWSSEWVIRLGDGTEESRKRMISAVDLLWPYTSEFFRTPSYETSILNNTLIPDVKALKEDWAGKIVEIFGIATLTVPSPAEDQFRGKEGFHTAHLESLLQTMQSVARSQPAATW